MEKHPPLTIELIIDSLAQGGAQRQISMLAVLLKQRGHDVRMVTYYPFEFFKPLLDKAGVKVECVKWRNQLHRVWAMRKAIRARNPDVVIAYQVTPSMLAELAGLPRRKFALLVGERNLDVKGGPAFSPTIRFFFHRLADAVVSNSYAQQDYIETHAPHLKDRLQTIWNCVDLAEFFPGTAERSGDSQGPRLLCLGRFDPQKNHLGLLRALEILSREHPEINVTIDAYGDTHFIDGKPGPQSGFFLEFREALESSPARSKFHIHDAVTNPAPLYQSSSALCLASFYEGCSNVICEAMSCGSPILASSVADNARLVEDGKNGFLFNPNDPRSIAEAILRFASLSPEQSQEMGRQSRIMAERMFDPHTFVERYEQVMRGAVNSRSSRPISETRANCGIAYSHEKHDGDDTC